MSANERRAEIMRIMVARRQENMQVLAAELGVTDTASVTWMWKNRSGIN